MNDSISAGDIPRSHDLTLECYGGSLPNQNGTVAAAACRLSGSAARRDHAARGVSDFLKAVGSASRCQGILIARALRKSVWSVLDLPRLRSSQRGLEVGEIVGAAT
jgi:hypothetical protein